MWTMRGQRTSWPIPDDDVALVVADVHIDRLRRAVTVGDRRVRLRRRQFDLLVALAEADGQALTRADLLRASGSAARDPRTRTIDVQIGQLRAALASKPGRHRDRPGHRLSTGGARAGRRRLAGGNDRL